MSFLVPDRHKVTEPEQYVTWTTHAREVIRRRGIDPQEVLNIVRRPQGIEAHEGRYRLVGNGLCVIVADAGRSLLIVSVLKRDTEQWTDEDLVNRNNKIGASA